LGAAEVDEPVGEGAGGAGVPAGVFVTGSVATEFVELAGEGTAEPGDVLVWANAWMTKKKKTKLLVARRNFISVSSYFIGLH